MAYSPDFGKRNHMAFLGKQAHAHAKPSRAELEGPRFSGSTGIKERLSSL